MAILDLNYKAEDAIVALIAAISGFDLASKTYTNLSMGTLETSHVLVASQLQVAPDSVDKSKPSWDVQVKINVVSDRDTTSKTTHRTRVAYVSDNLIVNDLPGLINTASSNSIMVQHVDYGGSTTEIIDRTIVTEVTLTLRHVVSLAA